MRDALQRSQVACRGLIQGRIAAGELSRAASGSTAALTGRVTSLRRHGRVAFIDVADATGEAQLLLESRTGPLSARFSVLPSLSVGDWVHARGHIGESRRGTRSLVCDDLRVLSKCLRAPAIGSQPGASAVHLRAEALIASASRRQGIGLRSCVTRSLREILWADGFEEHSTPALQPGFSGGFARPFRTHCHALKGEMFLRASSEFYMKQLAAAGFEKIFEIGPCFRNEGIERYYSPEFTMLEAYWAYAGLEEMAGLVQGLVCGCAATLADRAPKLRPHLEGFQDEWTTISYQEACAQYLGVTWQDSDDADEVANALETGGYPQTSVRDAGALHIRVAERLLAPRIFEPTLLRALPATTSPLMREDPDSPGALERIWVVAGGIFFCDLGVEETDPIQQRRRLREQADRSGARERLPRLEAELLEVLSLGVPPLAGLGLGVDRLVAALLGKDRIHDLVAFPMSQMRLPATRRDAQERRPAAMLKSAALRPGDKVAVVALSAPLGHPQRLERGLEALRSLGWEPRVFPCAAKVREETAGTIAERCNDLHAAFADPEIRAVFQLYGGYDTNQLLPHLEWELLAANPKVLCGYSDTSALLLAATAKSGLVTFHGPAVLPEFGEPGGPEPYTCEQLLAAVAGTEAPRRLSPPGYAYDEFRAWGTPAELTPPRRRPVCGWRWLRPGEARGRLLGGHLGTVLSLAGSPFWPDWRMCIAFFEDLEPRFGEFRRSIAQLQQLGVFDRLAGLVLGRFARVSGKFSANAHDWLAEFLKRYSFPVLVDVDIGHTDPMLTLPLGVEAELRSSEDVFLLTESAVLRPEAAQSAERNA